MLDCTSIHCTHIHMWALSAWLAVNFHVRPPKTHSVTQTLPRAFLQFPHHTSIFDPPTPPCCTVVAADVRREKERERRREREREREREGEKERG